MQEIARPADGGKLPQVMNDEEGLRGCWFAGSIAQLCASHALVSYADLEDEANGGPLQEWFLLARRVHWAAECFGGWRQTGACGAWVHAAANTSGRGALAYLMCIQDSA